MNNQIKKRAFTLVELLMVLGIISIMMILLIPSINPIKTEVKNLSLTKNKENLEGLVQVKTTRLNARGLGGEILLDTLILDLNTEDSLNNMTNPFNTSNKGIGLIKGNTYDNTNKAAYLFTEEPIVESLPKGTISLVVNPEEVVPNNTTWISIAINSQSFNTAIKKYNNTYVLGRNDSGQLGLGDTINKSIPTLLTLTPTVKPKSIVIGSSHSIAIGEDGNLYTWGLNRFGQLGTGDTTDRLTPTLITLPNGAKPTSIVLGSAHSLAIGTDGNLYTWGNNSYGQLGDGTTTNKTTPTLINLLGNAKPKSIYAGYTFSLAVGMDGLLYTWGSNTVGQLGIGDNVNKTIPTIVKLPTGVAPKEISIGQHHTLMIGANGDLYTWGINGSGQLGDGTTTDKTTPTLITLSNGVKPKSIAAGGTYSTAIGDDGNLYSWGSNTYSQLGTGDTTDRLTPTLINLPNEVKPTSIVAGTVHVSITTKTGEIYSWGYNEYGQLGTGDTTNRLSPTLVKPFDLIK